MDGKDGNIGFWLAVLLHVGPNEDDSVLDILAYQAALGENGSIIAPASGELRFRVRQSVLVAEYGFLQGAMALELCTLPTYQSGKRVVRDHLGGGLCPKFVL